MNIWGKHGIQQDNCIGKFEILKKIKQIISNKFKYWCRNTRAPSIGKPRTIVINFLFAG